jgi:hypothetical protein
MIYNELFESIIRTSGQDTEDVFAEYDNFRAPVPVIERMFEQVLREAHLQEMSESTSKQTGIVFASLSNTKSSQGIDPLTDDEINKTTDTTITVYGGGSNKNFYLIFSEQENKSPNKINAWLENYLISIKKNVNRALTINDIIG